ncbi:MAG TPA: hypothetical protein VFS36_10630 [Chitinophagaceae bacterium]|jgi:signal transduction histidine kinase|nr:hypothetical protein [Chitinophagaceae bacterium]
MRKVLLHQLVSRIITEVSEEATRRGCCIVNELARDIYLEADETMVETVLVKLLDNTIHSSCNGCIRITASVEDDTALIKISDNNSDYSRYISGKMNKVQPLIKKMNGDINFEFTARASISIILSFPLKKKAA